MLTCVVSIKDRPVTLAGNFYTSVIAQTIPCKLIVVDYGSRPENLEWERRMFKDDLVIVGNAQPLFNISHANNIGIRRAKTEWVMTCGIDMIFSENLMETYLRAVTDDPKTLIGCSPSYLDSDGKEYKVGNRPCCLCFNRHWLNSVQGYDENFKGWGSEDEDIRRRALESGYHLMDARPRAWLIHQHHELTRDMRQAQVNNNYLNMPGKGLKRNPDGWGKCTVYIK